ncbi:MAG: bifunctional tetrahydrofolate synthase/dihydrofolate synthase [Woeseia sp.]
MTYPSAFTSLTDWLSWLETLSPREIDLGLERVLAVLERLQLGKAACVVHVAGTNGKGSSAATLEALLLDAGYRVGCYTSPHLLRYNERIRVDGVPADDREIIAAFEQVEAVREDVPLTYFEYGTLAALIVFERNGMDTLVLEIGMGGRLDAVNAIEPDAGIITNVALDHCDWLGSDVETIAREKAGIMRCGKPVIFGSHEVPAAIESIAAELGADLRILGRDFTFAEDPMAPGAWAWHGREIALEGLTMPSLTGRFQLQNASAVLALLESLGLTELLTREGVSEALGGVAIPGRFQWFGTDRRWLFDVAHNPHAASGLAESLAALRPRRAVTAIAGVLADKDLQGIVAPLAPYVDRWIAVNARSPRALEARKLAQSIAHFSNKPCLIIGNLPEAMHYADNSSDDDALILVTGSFYTVGPALEEIGAGLGLLDISCRQRAPRNRS